MLKGLDTIDWNALNASETPKLLSNLGSRNAHLRQAAERKLRDSLVPDLLLDGAGSYLDLISLSQNPRHYLVVSFLIQILRQAGTVPDKLFLLELLYDLDRFPIIVPMYMGNSEQSKTVMVWAKAIHDEIIKGQPVYFALLDSSESDVVEMAGELINLLDKTQTFLA